MFRDHGRDDEIDLKRYWRGPASAIINWLLIKGLYRNGQAGFAEELRRSTISAIETEGFSEYFDPKTGDGCGGLGFSWTAAAVNGFRTAPIHD